MIVNIFVIFMFVIRPVLLLFDPITIILSLPMRAYNGLYNVNVNDILPGMWQGIRVCLLGLISIYSGYYLCKMRQILPGNTNIEKQNLIKRFIKSDFIISFNKNYLIKVILLFMLSLLLFFVFLLKYNPVVLLQSAGIRSVEGVKISAVFLFWIQIFFVACIFYNIYLINNNKPTYPLYLLIVLFTAMCAFLASRSYAINLFLAVITINYYLSKDRKINFKTIIPFILIILVIVGYGALRASNRKEVSYQSISAAQKIVNEFNMFDAFVLAIDHQQRYKSPFFYGASYAGGLLNFVPRDFWPGKPLPFDFEHTKYLYKGTVGGGLPTSLIGSLYLNFSVPGVILGCFIFGCLIYYVYTLLIRKHLSTLSVCKYTIFVTFIYDIIRVGDLTRELSNFLIYYFFYFAAFYFLAKQQNVSKKL